MFCFSGAGHGDAGYLKAVTSLVSLKAVLVQSVSSHVNVCPIFFLQLSYFIAYTCGMADSLLHPRHGAGGTG